MYVSSFNLKLTPCLDFSGNNLYPYFGQFLACFPCFRRVELMQLMVFTCKLIIIGAISPNSQVLVKVNIYCRNFFSLPRTALIQSPLRFLITSLVNLWKRFDRSLSDKKLYTFERDNKSGFSNCSFSTFLFINMKSLYMSRYLVVVLSCSPCFVLAS